MKRLLWLLFILVPELSHAGLGNGTRGPVEIDSVINCVGSSLNMDAGTLYLDCANNLVGVANTAPAYPLDVTGAIRTSTQLITVGSVTVNGNAFSVGGSTFTVSQGTVSVAGPYFSVGVSTFIITGGRVGVGTGSPQESLGVNGNIDISPSGGYLSIGGANAMSRTGGNLTMATGLVTLNLSPVGAVNIPGQAITGGTLTVNGNAFSVGGSTLSIASGIVSASTQPFVDLTRTGAASGLGNNLYTKIYWDTVAASSGEVRQAMPIFTAASSGTFIVPALAGGVYSINCGINFATNATGTRGAAIFKNGTRIIENECTAVVTDTVACDISINKVLLAGDNIDCRAFQDSGGTLNTACNATQCYFNVLKIW